MNQILKERLRENEQVVWQGKPEDIKLFEKPFPGRIFTMWAVSVLLLVFTGWYSFSYGPAKELEPTLLRNVGIFCTAVSYTHLDVYKRQTRQGRFSLSRARIFSSTARRWLGVIKVERWKLPSVESRRCLLYTSRCV